MRKQNKGDGGKADRAEGASAHRGTETDNDWLSSLARRAAASERAPPLSDPSGVGGVGVAPPQTASTTTTKAERIERRENKRTIREERKRKAEEERETRKRARVERRTGRASSGASDVGRSTATSRTGAGARKGTARNMTRQSREALIKLSRTIDSSVTSRVESQVKRQGQRHDEPTLRNGIILEPKGKATKNSTIRENSMELQPRVRDYNGQGLVRPSLYISLRHPSFVPMIVSEFEEHVEGFFGKAKNKAAKKQAGADMLWRRCLAAKKGEGGNCARKDDSMKKKG